MNDVCGSVQHFRGPPRGQDFTVIAYSHNAVRFSQISVESFRFWGAHTLPFLGLNIVSVLTDHSSKCSVNHMGFQGSKWVSWVKGKFLGLSLLFRLPIWAWCLAPPPPITRGLCHHHWAVSEEGNYSQYLALSGAWGMAHGAKAPAACLARASLQIEIPVLHAREIHWNKVDSRQLSGLGRTQDILSLIPQECIHELKKTSPLHSTGYLAKGKQRISFDGAGVIAQQVQCLPGVCQE